MSEANKALVRAYVDAFNAGDFPRLRALFTPDAVIQGVLGWGPIDEIMEIWVALHEGLAMHLEIQDIVAEGDKVAVRFRETGTSRAPFRGMPATGKSYELIAMEWFEAKDGKLHRRWGARDAASHARQLGW